MTHDVPLISLIALGVVFALGGGLVAVRVGLSPFIRCLIAGASLAQIGEFSFILDALGKSLHPLPDQACALMLAGALLSIVVDPFVFRLAARRQTAVQVAA